MISTCTFQFDRQSRSACTSKTLELRCVCVLLNINSCLFCFSLPLLTHLFSSSSEQSEREHRVQRAASQRQRKEQVQHALQEFAARQAKQVEGKENKRAQTVEKREANLQAVRQKMQVSSVFCFLFLFFYFVCERSNHQYSKVST